MDLPDTVIAATIGALLGWLIKTIADTLNTWSVERKLINRTIYQLYLLQSHVDKLLDNHALWSVMHGESSPEGASSWKRMFGSAAKPSILTDLRAAALQLAELNPTLAYQVIIIADTLEAVFTHAATIDDSYRLKESAQTVQMLLAGLRRTLPSFTAELLRMRRFYRREVSDKVLQGATQRNETVETIVSDFRRERDRTTPGGSN